MACFFLIASLSSYLYLLFLKKNFYPELSNAIAQKLFLLLYISSYFGARLFSIIFEQKIKNLAVILKQLLILGAMTSYGGIIAAIIIGFFYLSLKKEAIATWLNILVPSGFLGLSIGRLGCFFNGDDCGLPTEGNPWWAFSFPNHQEPFARIPIQLIESFSVFILVFMLYLLQKQKNRLIGIIGLTLYFFLRWILSSYRFI